MQTVNSKSTTEIVEEAKGDSAPVDDRAGENSSDELYKTPPQGVSDEDKKADEGEKKESPRSDDKNED